MECFLVNPARPMVQSLNLEDLQAAAYERLLTSTGTRTVLIGRLYQFQSDCDRMVEAIPGFACTIGQIEDSLRSRGLSTVCSKEECLTRLVAAVAASVLANEPRGGFAWPAAVEPAAGDERSE